MNDWAWDDCGDDRITVHSDKEGASFDLTGRWPSHEEREAAIGLADRICKALNEPHLTEDVAAVAREWKAQLAAEKARADKLDALLDARQGREVELLADRDQLRARVAKLEAALLPLGEWGFDLTNAACHAGITTPDVCCRCASILKARAALAEPAPEEGT